MIALLIAFVGAQTGYEPTSNVDEHFKIDLDQKEMDTASDAADWDASVEIYSKGKNSMKSSKPRTIQGFSTSMTDGRPKLRGEPYYDMYAEYWKSHSYADDLVMSAFKGTHSFADKDDIFRAEVANKGAQYIVTWQYVIHEMEDSRMDCETGDDTNNDRGVKAWDETWAFWAGSMETGDCNDGIMGYQLAQKRCQNFGTCDKDTCAAQSNANMLQFMKGPQAGCSAGPVRKDIDCIVKEMTVPLIQGALRYGYKTGKYVAAGDHGEKFSKAWGEAWAFLAAVLPQIDNCDKCAAAILRENLDAGVPKALVMKDGYEKYRDAMRSTFACLGVTGEDIGQLAEAEGVDESYKSVPSPQTCPEWTVAGYVPATGTWVHAQIDLDHQVIDEKSDAFDWDAIEEIYTTGKHSTKSSGFRSIQGFSTATKGDGTAKLAGEKYFDIHAAYWGSPTYADDTVMAALKGTGSYADRANIFRAEVVNKGAQYMNTWMYVIHELEDAKNDCSTGDATANDRGVHAWDEGWMFYAGSLEGVDGCGGGYSSYQLAQKRCANFGTCHYSARCDYAAANSAMLKVYEEVRVGCQVGPTRDHIDEIVRLMVIPLIQGSIRYAYKLSVRDDRTADKFEKEWGEGWAFLAAVIPHIDACDSDAAALLRANMDVATPIDDVMKDGYEKYRDAIRSTYKCLGITCTDIGELDAAVDGGVATESTCTCAAYDGCVAPDEGPGRWWTIKEAHNYDGLVKPTRSVCGGDVYKPAGEEEEEEEEGSSESFAGALSVLLVAATM
jgi:hypothetical protein